MFESLVITLREGVEAALVVGIILAYLNRAGKSYLNRKVYLGLGAAIAASFVFAILFQVLGIDPENEYLEGALLGTAGILVASLVIWMWRVARNIREATEKRLASVVSQENRRYQGWGLFTFTFFMVFREGAETVLFLISATLGQFSLFNLLGGALGIGLAVLFALFFIKGSLRINLSRFFGVTSVVLLLLALKLVLGSVHEFAEVGVIPLTKEVMGFIGYFVRGNSSTIIMMALLAAPLLVILWGTQEKAVPEAGEETAALTRKRRAIRRQERMWRFGLVTAAFFILFAMGSAAIAGSSFTDPEPVTVTANGDKIEIPIAELSSGKLAKFVYNTDGVSVRFIVVRYSDDSISTALDACQICGAVGYGQEEEDVICKNCNAPIPLATIGQSGGCNPLPLAFEVSEKTVTVSIAELMQVEKQSR